MKTIKFASTVLGVNETHPVIKASDYKPSWFYEKSKELYASQIAANREEGKVTKSVFRCPAILEILRSGYIITAPWDIFIEPQNEQNVYRWSTPSNNLIELHKKYSYGQLAVSAHTHPSVVDIMPQKPGYSKNVLKIDTTWHVFAPQNLKFIIIPMPYSNEQFFEHAPGLFDPSIASILTAQLYWKENSGKHTIKAGTPLMQLIPLSENNFNFETSFVGKKEIDWIQKTAYLQSISYSSTKYKLIKLVHNNHFRTKTALEFLLSFVKKYTSNLL